ncbi:hypothetical protein METBIDRAFT_32958 [Metschnikowia bicuspidata var. bicuspidata NRRL YB-4993]|uniref:Altered inheritance of mitochondria protein 23, mitochondrial n=1 Tax=Metschnikowia bicuspidata var. bicuspidata NRRL YB-4993 TaxID=869754 RepID=A0A1A0H7D8_9ASCO|nr:hypothetical protein METBIDRAFT_32958 [Metschnikowia bicuspidata var. bicuspidata NRRL YB-4993]OBA19941.1 hypothetical protein METBIDRAFT_32958 [Metschnikowia bicuspidata var. bicuspidata NRRL YB-4993]
MMKRSLIVSARRFIQIPQGPYGDQNRFRAAFGNSQRTDAKQERSPDSPNTFRFSPEKSSLRGKWHHKRNDYGSEDRNKYPSRGGSWSNGRHDNQSRQAFNFSTGSERAQTALKSLILKVKSKSSNFNVNYVDPETKEFLTVSLQTLVNKLDLQKEGIRVLPPQGEGPPIIRVIPVEEMLENYSKELAALKQQELFDMGSTRAVKLANMRAQAERKKSATKILTLSWSISVSDLLNQKKNEIEKRMKKDGKLVIFVGEKSSLSAARINAEKEDVLVNELKTSNTNWNSMDEDAYLLEVKKRELIYAKLQEILQELGCKIETSGSLDTRMMIKMSSNSKSAAQSETSHQHLSPKELKKLKKLEKAKERVKAKELKLAEEEIDSLYQLKIED